MMKNAVEAGIEKSFPAGSGFGDPKGTDVELFYR